MARATLTPLRSFLFCAAGAAAGLGQALGGTLSGTVTGPGGLVLPDARVRARSESLGAEARGISTLEGRYRLEDLPAGTYTVSAAMPCCSFQPFEREGVEISARGTVELDIELDETLVILGDDPALTNAELRSRQQVPDAEVPRAADGHPDLSGVWFITTEPLGEQPAIQPWVVPIVEERIANSVRDHPHNSCLPGDVFAPGAASFLTKFVQTPELLVILFEDLPGFRQVFMDGRGHPERINPTWMGHSIGRWDGDTLVIETIGFNDRGWTDIYPRSEQMKLEERYTRSEYGRIDAIVTVEDPGVFEAPWQLDMRLDLAPQLELFEYVCENNKWGGGSGQ